MILTIIIISLLLIIIIVITITMKMKINNDNSNKKSTCESLYTVVDREGVPWVFSKWKSGAVDNFENHNEKQWWKSINQA